MTKNEKDRVSILFNYGGIQTHDQQVQSQPDDTMSGFLNYLLSPDDEEKQERVSKESQRRHFLDSKMSQTKLKSAEEVSTLERKKYKRMTLKADREEGVTKTSSERMKQATTAATTQTRN